MTLSLTISKYLAELLGEDAPESMFSHIIPPGSTEKDKVYMQVVKDGRMNLLASGYRLYRSYLFQEIPWKLIGEKKGYEEEGRWRCKNYNPKAVEQGERGCESEFCTYAGWKDMEREAVSLYEILLTQGWSKMEEELSKLLGI